jgi:hypothetical protein
VPLPGVRQPEPPSLFVGRAREIAWLRDGHGGCVLVEGAADIDPDSGIDPRRMITTVANRRLELMTLAARRVLRWAAMFGVEFELGDLAALLHTSPSELVGVVEQATAAGMLADAGHRLALRDPAIRDALYEDRPVAVRAASHREAAQALAAASAPVERVAARLQASSGTFDAWCVRWLLGNVEAVASRDAELAVELLERALDGPAIAAAPHELWYVESVRRDIAALAHVNNALAAATGNADLTDLRVDLLGARLFTLQNLDRLTDATGTVARTRWSGAPAVRPDARTSGESRPRPRRRTPPCCWPCAVRSTRRGTRSGKRCSGSPNSVRCGTSAAPRPGCGGSASAGRGCPPDSPRWPAGIR